MGACIQWSAHLARGRHSDSCRPVVIHVSQLVCQPGERRGGRREEEVEKGREEGREEVKRGKGGKGTGGKKEEERRREG